MKSLKLKNELKKLAAEIRITKQTIKNTQSSGGYAGKLQWTLPAIRSEYRHKHIAYCLLRGRKMEQIEKPGQFNQPNMTIINAYIKEIQLEAVCAG